MAKEKEVQLGYRITKIQTTKFGFSDLEEDILTSLFASPNDLGININVGMNIDKEKSTVVLDILTDLFNAQTKESLVEHSGRTVFYVEGLDNVFNQEKNAFDLPNPFLAQLYGIAYTHSRALLATELSPTIYKEKYFLPVINPMDLLKQNSKQK